jgi:NAD(P)-dependent dehydrogenase (short-subunit alcohol dehydrogenase family)
MSRFHYATAVIVGGSRGIGFRLAEDVLAAGGLGLTVGQLVRSQEVAR